MPLKSRTLLTVFLFLMVLFEGKNSMAGTDKSALPYRTMMGALSQGSAEDVRVMADHDIGINEVDPDTLETPLIYASTTDQWPSAEILIDHGANIWAHDKFGVTAAQMAVRSRILPGSLEDRARLRAIDKMKAQGYPFPPPDRDEVLRLDREGKWPVKRGR